MTIQALLLDWTPEGALSSYEFGQRGDRYFTFRRSEDGHWYENTFQSRNGRALALISTDVDYLVEEFQRVLPGFLRVLDDLSEALGTLLFTIRTCCDIGGGRVVLGGMAFIPQVVPLAQPLNGADPADLISQFCTGIEGQDSQTLHPALREAFAREIARRAEREAQRKLDAEAEAKSLLLLESFLDQEQLAELRAVGMFHVRLKDGRLFRFTKRFGHNVHLIENGLCTIEYCIISIVRVPLYDQMLAQKVLLEALPEEFFRIANYYRHRNPTAETPTLPPLAEVMAELAQV